MTLEELHGYTLRITKGWFADHGDLPPIFVGVDPEERLHLIMATGWADNKEFCRLFTSGYFCVHGIKSYAFTSEIWFTEYAADEIPKKRKDLPEPRNDPRRKEGLLCGVVNADRIFQTVHYIVRAPKVRASVGDEHKLGRSNSRQGDVKLSGLLTDLLVDESKLVPGAKEMMRKMIEWRALNPKLTPSIPVIKVLTPQDYTAPSFNS